MASKQIKVSVNKLEKYCKDIYNGLELVEREFKISDGDTVTYQIKPQLSLEECIKFIDDVVSECVRTEDMMFIPIAKQFVTKKNIMTYYGNFTMPKDINKAFEFVMASGRIIDAILSSINTAQYNMLCDSIDEGISFEQRKMVSAQELRTSAVITEVRQFTERMSGLFDGVDGEQMASFISGISKIPEVTAGDLASAIVSKA